LQNASLPPFFFPFYVILPPVFLPPCPRTQSFNPSATRSPLRPFSPSSYLPNPRLLPPTSIFYLFLANHRLTPAPPTRHHCPFFHNFFLHHLEPSPLSMPFGSFFFFGGSAGDKFSLGAWPFLLLQLNPVTPPTGTIMGDSWSNLFFSFLFATTFFFNKSLFSFSQHLFFFFFFSYARFVFVVYFWFLVPLSLSSVVNRSMVSVLFFSDMCFYRPNRFSIVSRPTRRQFVFYAPSKVFYCTCLI